MPQFIVFLTPAKGDEFVATATDEERAIVGQHFQYLIQQRDAGNLLLAGRTQEAPFIGIAIIEAADLAAAEEFARVDPAVASGVFVARVQPYQIAVSRWDDD